MELLIPFALLALFLFFRANPQRRRVEAQRAMLHSLAPGARIVTAGGFLGTVAAVDAEKVSIELAPGVVVDVLPAAVVRVVEPAPLADNDVIDLGATDDAPNGSQETTGGEELREPSAPHHEES